MLTDQEALENSFANDKKFAKTEETEENSLLKLLVYALTSEHLAAYQYWTCYQGSRGIGKTDCDPEFRKHYAEETDHAEKLMKRINELGGRPVADPTDWTKIYEKFVPIDTTSVKEMLEINIQAEKDAIILYKRILELSEKLKDMNTHRISKEILSDEEEHLYDLNMLIGDCFA